MLRMKLSVLKQLCVLSFAALVGGVLSADPAAALIVWNGQIVQSWPDQEPLPGPLGLPARGLGGGGGPEDGHFYTNPTGEVLALTLLVDFSDQEPAFSVDEVDAWLNQPGFSEGGLNGSVRDYYFDVSNGILELQNEVYGFYRAENPKSYYEEGGGYQRAGILVDEMIEYFDDMVDYSRFDNDGDGSVDAISIVYAGPSVTFGQGLWPHAGGMNENRDGVRLSRYMMTQMGNNFGLYVFVHETGHMLFGWPDLYGFGDYCVMGNATNPRNPAGINDFYRADQGWIPVVDVDPTRDALYTARVSGAGYRYINPDDPNELFFWSNVRDEGRFSVVNGSGLLMFHFDFGIRRNDPPNPLGLAVVQADGEDQLGATTWPSPGSDPDDFFHAGHNAEFADATSPPSEWNDGSGSGLRIHEISANDEVMTFAVGAGEAPDVPEPEPDPIGGGGAGGATAGGSGGEAGAAGAGGDVGGMGGGAGDGSTAGAAGTASGGLGGMGGAGGSAGGVNDDSAGTSPAGTAGMSVPEPEPTASARMPTTPPPATEEPATAAPTLSPSASGSAPSSVASDTSDSDSSGCGCSVPASPSGGSVPSLVVFCLGWVWRNRRRAASA